MSQQIEDIFVKFKKLFKGRIEEIKEFLLRHFENAFYSRPVIKVDRKDATDRLKLSGFSENLSSWRNFYRNIVVSSCVIESGIQKRYDYKFYFTKEKVDDATIDVIQNALDEASRLRRNFRFDEAIEKIDEMIALAHRKKDDALEKILNEKRDEVVVEKEKYDKEMENIAKLEDKIKINQEYDNLKPIISDCDKIIKIANSIKKKDIAKKYAKILEDTQKELEERKAREKALSEAEKKVLEEKRAQQRAQAEKEKAALKAKRAHEKAIADEEKSILEAQKKIKKTLSQQTKQALKEKELKAKRALEKAKTQEAYDRILEQISKLEYDVKMNRANRNYKAAINDCKKIIKLANSINRDDNAKRNADLLDEILKEIEASKTREKEKALEAKIPLKKVKIPEKAGSILEQISKLEESVKKNRESGNLKAAISDCKKIIKMANSINRDNIVQKYAEILAELEQEIDAQKAQEKEKALDEKMALKEAKAQEKAKVLEAKKALMAAKAKEREEAILAQITALADSLKNNRENGNLKAAINDCGTIIKLANSINRNDIEQKYAEILAELQKAIKGEIAQEKAKALEAQEILKAIDAKEEEETVLLQIYKLEEGVKNNQKNGDLQAAINDCGTIILLANSINRDDIAEKYAGILEELQNELETGKDYEKEEDLDVEVEETKIKGEFLFLIKDFALARIPNLDIIKIVSEKGGSFFAKYKQELDDFFNSYDPNQQTLEETIELANILLKPDIYDFLSLMRNNYYPLDKIPKILSKWADVDTILEELMNLNILTVIKEGKKKWLILLTDIKPLIIFPEHTFPKIRKAFKDKKITYEVAKKAYDLMEVTYVEKLVF